MSSLTPYADLKVKVREYTDKDGKTKGVYEKIGTMFSSPHESHYTIKIDTLPIDNEWKGWVSVFPRDEGSGYQKAVEVHQEIKGRVQQKETVLDDIEDEPVSLSDIPF